MQCSQSSASASAGFTLVELMVAILLLVVGVLAALSMVSTSLRSNSLANVISVKTALAQQAMEYMLSLDPASEICDPYLDTTPNNVMVPGSAGVAGTFNLNRSITSTCPGSFVDDEEQPASGTNKKVKGAGVFRASYTTTPDVTSGLTRIQITVASTTAPKGQDVTISCLKRVNR